VLFKSLLKPRSLFLVNSKSILLGHIHNKRRQV